ncbi:MAG: TadE/TadG family type IV pilus assembly protein [Anaerolineae bacterium]
MEHKRPRAQSLVEFALLLPVLLLIILTLIDTAFVFQGYLTVAHAAREGMRFAVVYRPNQGECLHRDSSGLAIPEPYPDCPVDYAEDPTETDSHYFARRSLLIKRAAIQATTGLRTETICDGADSAACITAHYNEPGMLGVRIWGFQSFEESEQLNMPGLQGLPVRVQVIHNVPLVVYGAFLPDAHIQVRSAAGGINEGVQVGFGNQPPPTFGAVPPPVPPGTALPTPTPVPTPTPGGPTPTPTPLPNYTITLNFETALNELPDDRSHGVIARVQDESGNNIAGARVTFHTDFGSFSVSGVGTPSIIVSTDSNGLARTTLYANRPGTSLITAWLNWDNDGEVDPEEPADTATKTWVASGPYLIVSNHNPVPNDWLAVSVMDHPPTGNPHSLWWCPTLVTSTQVIARLAYPVNVDSITWDLEDVPVQVPLGVAGSYRIESHSGDGGANGCAQSGSLVAYSGPIEIAAVPPDLIIQNVTVVDQPYIRPGEPITLVITVTNQSPIAIDSGPFDVDVYIPQDNAPQVQQMGISKHWAPNLGPLTSYVLTTTITVYTYQPQTLWAQVDTTNYINEGEAGGEDNNTFGPIIIQPQLCVPFRGRDDNFDNGLGGQWTGLDLPTPSQSVVGGQLQIMPNRGRIGGINNTGTDLDGAHYVYQGPISGDFDIRLRVISIGSTDTGAEAGLMVRESMALNSRYFATLVKRANTVHQDYRLNTGGAAAEGGGNSISLPLWVRITRTGNVFRSYSSTNGSTWTERSSSRTIAMGAVYVGIFANSDDRDIPGPALFDDFTVSSGAASSDNFNSGLGGQWASETLLRGSESVSGGTLAVTSGWGDIGTPSNYDSFRYLYQSPVSGNFSMTVQVSSLGSVDTDSNAGLMVRASLAPDAVHYSFFQTRNTTISREYRATTGGNPTVNTNTANPPQYLQIAREGNVFRAYSSVDGTNWTLRRTDTLNNMPDSVYIGLATSSDNAAVGPAVYDNFTVCAPSSGSVPPTPEPPAIYPPGLTQCTELLSVAGFEGNPETVFALWKAGDRNGLSGAFQRTSAQFRRGSFSMRLHASGGAIPCNSSQFQPYLYQLVTMPTEVFTFSTVTVSGYYFVERSTLECSLGTTYDSDDVLNINLYPAGGGAALLAPQTVINGGSPSGTWYPVQINLETAMTDPSAYAGQTLRMQWDGFNDTDVNGTFFYLDDLSMQVCTTWPVPPDQPDTASVGGLVRTRGQNNLPVILPGADVWAYAQGGEVLHTRTIQDGTYHFYNITPGTYVIYAEAWISGQLRMATTQVTVVANERNYNINLLLQ